MLVTPAFWAGRRVLVTGHTGFKGAWLAFWLAELGAEVSGLALAPEAGPNLHDILNIAALGRFVRADINDRPALDALLRSARPEVVIHMAAQALVRRGYAMPVETFATNILGTATLLDAVRRCPETKAVLIVTSDKVYETRGSDRDFQEADRLGGRDPYAASKAGAEIVTTAMRQSFFGAGGHAARIATARAGNVIGGGDWAQDRLVPDIVRGCLGREAVVRLRAPAAVRPWQHVLDPLHAYLLLAERLHAGQDNIAEAWNIGPDSAGHRTVRQVAEAMIAAIGRGRIEIEQRANAVTEAQRLRLDNGKLGTRLGWRPRLDFSAAVALTASWYAAWARGEAMAPVTRKQIGEFIAIGT